MCNCGKKNQIATALYAPRKPKVQRKQELVSEFYTKEQIQSKIDELTSLLSTVKYGFNKKTSISKLKKVLQNYETAIKTKEIDGLLS